jgi:hypothetical protein
LTPDGAANRRAFAGAVGCALQALLPNLPASISRSVVDATIQLRLPK